MFEEAGGPVPLAKNGALPHRSILAMDGKSEQREIWAVTSCVAIWPRTSSAGSRNRHVGRGAKGNRKGEDPFQGPGPLCG